MSNIGRNLYKYIKWMIARPVDKEERPTRYQTEVTIDPYTENIRCFWLEVDYLSVDHEQILSDFSYFVGQGELSITLNPANYSKIFYLYKSCFTKTGECTYVYGDTIFWCNIKFILDNNIYPYQTQFSAYNMEGEQVSNVYLDFDKRDAHDGKLDMQLMTHLHSNATNSSI